MPPRILPFTQNHHLSEGNRLTLTCVVTEGDLPLAITWYKDGERLDARPQVTQRTWGDFNSHLGIAHVLPHHAGNYTCRASNRAASDSQTAMIYVNGMKLTYSHLSNPFSHQYRPASRRSSSVRTLLKGFASR